MSTNNRLPAVDGLRAVAALWVVLFHISALSHAQFPWIPGIDLFMRSGSTGVSLFLVLSGFCLFLPFAGGRTARFKSRAFFYRRFRRLAPAYYTSLILSLALALVTADWLHVAPMNPLEAGWQMLTHATLTHSLFPDTFYALNGAYWSLGLEWQLYLGLPLLIVGIRRFGLAPTLTVAVACNVLYRLALGLAISRNVVPAGSALADVVLPNQLFGRWAEFALGMLAAELYVSGRLARARRYLPLFLVAIVVLIPLGFLVTRLQLSHIAYGTLFATLLCVTLMSDNFVTRTLAWRPLVIIGTLSYSLYLLHQPIIQGVVEWFSVYQPSASPTQVFMWLLALVPVILLLAWVLFVTVERRTLGANAETLIPRFRWPIPVLSTFARPVAQAAAKVVTSD